jgi:hypothetical protein
MWLDFCDIEISVSDDETIHHSHLGPIYSDEHTSYFSVSAQKSIPRLNHLPDVKVKSNVELFFRLKKSNWHEARKVITHATLKMVSHTTWEFILFHGDSKIACQRNNDELIINSNLSFWKREIPLSEIDIPYILKELDGI